MIMKQMAYRNYAEILGQIFCASKKKCSICFGAKNSYDFNNLIYLFDESLIRLGISRLNKVGVISGSKSCFEHIVIIKDQALVLRRQHRGHDVL